MMMKTIKLKLCLLLLAGLLALQGCSFPNSDIGKGVLEGFLTTVTYSLTMGYEPVKGV